MNGSRPSTGARPVERPRDPARRYSAPRQFAVWAAASAAAAAFVLALALLLGGGAPAEPPPGLTGPARLPAWCSELAELLGLGVGVVAVGFGAMALLGSREATRIAAGAAAGWTAVTVLQLGIRAWERDELGGLFGGVHGEALVIQGLCALVAAAGWAVADDAPGRLLAMPAAVVGLVPVSLVGHPRSSQHPWLAGASLSVHVVAAALWVGGLAALAWVAIARAEEWTAILPRYSWLAAGCAAAVVLSGVVAALERLTPSELITSRYGAIVSLKVALLAGLVAAGWLQRRHVVPRARTARHGFVALATFELTAMAITLALASALAETPPPA